MLPDYQKAAAKAKEIFEKYGTNNPLDIIKKQPCVLVMSFAEMAAAIGVKREKIVTVCGEDNYDAITTVQTCSKGNTRYLITYNQQLSDWQIKKALARELGHIVLGHDGSRSEEVRNDEALCFSYHFICQQEGMNSND